MTVGEVLSYTEEYTDVRIFNTLLSEVVAEYNGKDSIDLDFNGLDVKSIAVHDNYLYIAI